MKAKTKLFKSAGMLLTIAGLCSVMSSCSVPPEIKHKNINEFFEKVDISSAGEIISKETDVSGGVTSASWVTLRFDNEETFTLLRDRFLENSDISCQPLPKPPYDTQMDCEFNNVKITLAKNANGTSLYAYDSSNGSEK